MSLVYEIADAKQRKILLGSLSRTLTTGKRQSIEESKVDAFGSGSGPAGTQLSNAGTLRIYIHCITILDCNYRENNFY